MRVHLVAIADDFVVKVRAGGTTRGANITDDLSLTNARALTNAATDSAHVGISCFVAIGVANADIVAVSAIAPCHFYSAIAGGVDRCAGWCREVCARVKAGIAKNRMATIAETGRDSRSINGRFHQKFFHRATLLVEIIPAAIAWIMAPEGAFFAAHGHGGVEDVAFPHGGAVFVIITTEQNFERIALADIPLEVDVVGIHADHLNRDGGRDADFSGCEKEARIDCATGADIACLKFSNEFEAGILTFVRATDCDFAVHVRFHGDGRQGANQLRLFTFIGFKTFVKGQIQLLAGP